MNLRIDEAIAHYYLRTGKKIMKKDIAAKLWPNSVEITQRINMTRLCTGKTDTVRIEWINAICDILGCTSDFLIGRSDE